MLLRADTTGSTGAFPPWAVAGLIHLACVAAWYLLASRNPVLGAAGAWPWLEGASAAVLGACAGLAWWWLPINLLFMPAVQALLVLHVPAAAYLAAFCVLLLVNAGAWCQRVPLYLSSAKAGALVLSLLPARGGFRFLDLGCGTGSLLDRIAHARPDGHYDGIELAPLPYWVSRWRARRHAHLCVKWGDFWNTDLSRYDIVYAYLSPAPMARLWGKARREMRPGSLFVSNGFSVPGVAATQEIAVGDHTRSTLHVWRM